jgi:hypothetical protein
MVEELVKMVEYNVERGKRGGFGYEVVRILMDWQCLLRGIMHSARYIDALVPAAIPTSPSVSFSAFFRVPTPVPWCLRPQRALLAPCGPLLSVERYNAASGEGVSARPPALIRSMPRHHYLIDRPSMRRPLKMTLMKRLSF